MSERPSWYTCEVCHVPATSERPLARFAVKTNTRAVWAIHLECKPALQETLIEGTELVQL